MRGKSRKLFLNRDLSWLEFNRRVLYQAQDSKNHPLLERVRFLSIFSSNLDEFIMKRVGHLKWRIEKGAQLASLDGRYPTEILSDIRILVLGMMKSKSVIFQKSILPELKQKGIELLNWDELKVEEINAIKGHFKRNIYPILTPLALDLSHPFPLLSNLSTSIGVKLKNDIAGQEFQFARVKVPNNLPKWVNISEILKIPGKRFVRNEDVILNNLNYIFPNSQIHGTAIFRVTRSADIVHLEDDPEDIVDLIEEELRLRKVAPVVRLEHRKESDPWILELLKEQLGVSDDSVYETPGELNYRTLDEIASLDLPALKYRPWFPVTPAFFLEESKNIFTEIKRRDILVHHPFHNFTTTVEEFVRTSCYDPDVYAIKVTIYRTAKDSNLINYLIEAAENGKQVVCILEVKARFDEELNLYWAEKLEKAGVHVVYGILGLKTHSKMILVVRKEFDKFRNYVHIGTGNYNAQTAKVYTDFGLFTTNSKITNEVVEVFNYLTGLSIRKNYKKLLVSPVNMRESFTKLIKNEIKNKKEGKDAEIVAKMNSLEDKAICKLLYDASKAGVKVRLIVRGFCCLRPGLKGLSENITVYSIIGRFLEHTRLFYFRDGATKADKGKFYIGSADWMHRNLDERVEVIVPVMDEYLKKTLWQTLKLYFQDTRQKWKLDSEGTYIKVAPPKGVRINMPAQELLMDLGRGIKFTK